MSIPSLSTLTEEPITSIRAGVASGLSLYRKQRSKDVSKTDPAAFDRLLDRYDDETVFVHAGLSDVKSAFDTNPYTFLRDRLTDHFENVLAPGYTPSFKRSGVYHRKYSMPQYGAFSRLLLDDADHRTDDPIHSILVCGSYRFDGVTKRTTFGPEGPFAKLRDENVLYLNVGISQFHSTQLHMLENEYDVPYIDATDHEGVVYHDERTHEEVVQTNFTNKNPHLYAYNRQKIRKRLEDAGVLDTYDLNGLTIYATRARAIHRILGRELEKDPYYLAY